MLICLLLTSYCFAEAFNGSVDIVILVLC